MLSFRPVGVALFIGYAAVALGIGLKRRIPLRRQVLPFILFVYVLAVIAVTLFPIPIEPGMRHIEAGNNLVPFKTIVGVMGTGTGNALLNIGGNILLFVPFGFLWPLLVKRLNRPATIVALGFTASLVVELSQLTVSAVLGTTYRSFDVDDLITNTVGAIVGYILLRVVQSRIGNPQTLRLSRRTLALGISSLVFVAAVSAGGYVYAEHATPQKALETRDPNVLPLDSVPFAKGVVMITTTDPAAFKQQGYVAWYLKKRFWGWQVESSDVGPNEDRVHLWSKTMAGETFVWGQVPNQRAGQIVYRHVAKTYTSQVTQAGLWHLILPFSQTEFAHSDWSMILADGSTAPLLDQAH